MIRFRFRHVAALAAFAAALAFVVSTADARVGGGSSFGSRGMRTFSAPPASRTAPNVAPINRSMTQPGQPGQPGAAAAARPGTSQGGFFNRPGLLGGLAAGFLGAGLFGLLFGSGMFGGLGGIASVFGLLLQIALVVIVARLLWNWFARRNQPATASGPSMRHIYGDAPNKGAFDIDAKTGSDFFVPAKVDLTEKDFDQFEKLLSEIQAAYSAEDLNALRPRVTPEMLSYFSEELASNASRGVVNKVSDVKLLQGDLSEAWQEGDAEYASVAMRFSLVDRMVDRASGQVAEGGEHPQEVTEVWTFRRARGGAWMLSAIQQA